MGIEGKSMYVTGIERVSAKRMRKKLSTVKASLDY